MSTPASPPTRPAPTQQGGPPASTNGARRPQGTPRPPGTVTRPAKRRFSVGGIWRAARTTLRGQFVALAALLLALALGQTGITTARLRQADQDLVTIGKDSTPSVDAAQAMGQYIEEIDAKAADYLGTAGLAEQQPCSVPGSQSSVGQLTVHDCSDRVIAVGTALFNNELYKAVRNVTYPGERTALDRITAGYQEYSAAIAVMRHEYELAASKIDPNDPNLRRAYTAYLSASEVLHTRITRSPQADPNGSPVIDEASIPDCTIGTQVIPATVWPHGSLRQ